MCLARNANSFCLFGSSLRNCCQLHGKLVFPQPCVWSPFDGVFWFQTSGCFQDTDPALNPLCLLAAAVFQCMARIRLALTRQIFCKQLTSANWQALHHPGWSRQNPGHQSDSRRYWWDSQEDLISCHDITCHPGTEKVGISGSHG